MKKRYWLILSLCLVASLLVTGLASAGPPAKVEVCHLTSSETNTYVLITISENAFQTHIDHGDASPHEYVPGMPGYAFDGECVPYLLATEVMEINGVTGAVSTSVLTTKVGVQYKLEASGTYRFGQWGDTGIADAKYSYRPPYLHHPYPVNTWVDGADLPSPWEYYLQVLYANPTTPVYWIETFNEEHFYTADFNGNGAQIELFILDNAYGDNEGFITVTIKELP